VVWVWILLPVFLLVFYLLTAPFYLEIDTDADIFRIRFHRLASAALLITGDGIWIDLEVAWWQKRFDLLARKAKPKPTSKPPENKKPVKRKPISFATILAVLKTFKVKRFYLTADTGNPAFNGILYPAVYTVSILSGQNISVNFSGRNQLILEIKNNLARVSRAFIYSSLKTRTWKT